MKKFILFLLILFVTGTTLAQGKLTPYDNVSLPAGLEEFIVNLENAVDQKDKKFIINHMSANMMNSFGGDGGINEFKEYWNWDSDSTEFWNLMKHILQLDRGKLKQEDVYFIPYVFSEWPETYDPFEHSAITGLNVNVRNKPGLANSQVLGQLTYDIVKVNYEKSYPSFGSPRIKNVNYIGEKLWYYIESLDGKLNGYVYWKYIWSPVNYRLGVTKIEDRWLISFLVEGD
ncbi:hypothetical protein C9994_04690 [Marivirga lumbricoides]|uniref:SH3b domain-containing protein n=1 Tax=Marivirga lumbricoides TaxID=1046115 RepID=A0A2T4DT81_9BACT|nr:hypothetical protein C9994_04690 [Marivirga lumbricoides]